MEAACGYAGVNPVEAHYNPGVQRPEIKTMIVEEYDEFIKVPLTTIMEKFLPRVCAVLNKDPVSNSATLAAAFGVNKSLAATSAGVNAKMRAKYGYVPQGRMHRRG